MNDAVSELKSLRSDAKIFFREIEEACGLSRCYLSRIFNGRLVPRDTVLKCLCFYFQRVAPELALPLERALYKVVEEARNRLPL